MRQERNGYWKVEGLAEVESVEKRLREAARLAAAQTPMPALWRELWERAAQFGAIVSTYHQMLVWVPMAERKHAASCLYALISPEEKAAIETTTAVV